MKIVLSALFILFITACSHDRTDEERDIENKEYEQKRLDAEAFAAPLVAESNRRVSKIYNDKSKLFAGPKSEKFDNCTPVHFISSEIGDRKPSQDDCKGEGYDSLCSIDIAVTFGDGTVTEKQGAEIRFSMKSPKARKSKNGFVVTYDDLPSDYASPTNPCSLFKNDKRITKAIREKRAYVGMPELALYAAKGSPGKVNHTEVAGGRTDQFVYDEREFIYVSHGKVTAIQKF